MKKFITWTVRLVWTWQSLKILLWIITLGAFLWTEEVWRGTRRWAETKALWEAKGISLERPQFSAPRLPDDQNLAALAPFASSRTTLDTLALDQTYKILGTVKISSWKNGRLAEIGRIKTSLDELTRSRGVASPPQNMAEEIDQLSPILRSLRQARSKTPDKGFDLTSSSLEALSGFSRLLEVAGWASLDSLVALQQNRAEQALEDAMLNDTLARGCFSNPNLVSGLIGSAAVDRNFAAIYTGLTLHSWNDQQLAKLQADLSKFNFLRDYQESLKGDCVYFAIPQMKKAFGNHPEAGTWMSEVVNLELQASEWVNPRAMLVRREAAEARFEDYRSLMASWRIHLPWNFVFQILPVSNFYEELVKFSRMQAWVDQGLIVCALERYRLVHRNYPITLDQLVPTFIEHLPHDIMSGGAYHYLARPNDHWLLYSVGWNGRDEGGTVIEQANHPHHLDDHQGDWVWPVHD